MCKSIKTIGDRDRCERGERVKWRDIHTIIEDSFSINKKQSYHFLISSHHQGLTQVYQFNRDVKGNRNEIIEQKEKHETVYLLK